MRTRLIEYFPDLSEAQGEKKPREAENLDCREFGRCYKPGTEIYVGRIDAGKWIPASQDKQTLFPKTSVPGQKKPAKGVGSSWEDPSKQGRGEKKKGKGQLRSEVEPLPRIAFSGSKYVLNGIAGKSNKRVHSYGLGTPSSIAAEAATVYAANVLLEKYKGSNKPVNAFLMENNALLLKTIRQITLEKGSKVTADWENNIFNQVVGMFSVIGNKYGKIESIAWDHAQGRREIGIGDAKPVGDPSDVYVKVRGYGIIGVSLKKNGSVFVANNGWTMTAKKIEANTENEDTKLELQRLSKAHSLKSRTEEDKLVETFNTSKSTRFKMSELTRDNIAGADSKTYDKFFDEDGNFSDEFKEIVFSGKVSMGDKVGRGTLSRSNPSFSLFVKSMEAVNPELTKGLRSADYHATRELLNSVATDEGVHDAVRSYMVDALKFSPMLKEKPFGDAAGIRKVIAIYGEGTIDDVGNYKPMYIDDEALTQTFGPEVRENPEKAFYIDGNGDKNMGFVRLRVRNQTPPPQYHYPTVASLTLRSRTKGKGATLDVKQHEAFTHSLASRTPDPMKWKPTLRRNYAQTTLNFLEGQLASEFLSDEERGTLEQDVAYHEKMLADLT